MKWHSLRRDPIAFAVLIISLLVTLGAVAYAAVAPKPTTQGMAAKHQRRLLRSEIETKEAKERQAAAQAVVNARAWTVRAEDLTPKVLERVNAVLANRPVRLLTLQPQRPLTVDNLEQTLYTLTLEGPFDSVQAMIRQLDRGEPRLALNLVQFSSADQNTDKVTATLGLVAYRLIEDVNATDGQTPRQ
jgi:hypothetical protein